MKVLLFGKDGQVGWELNRTLQPFGSVVSLGRQDADFSNPEALRETIQTVKPDIIVNAVAYTSVDKAESEVDLAEMINGVAPKIIAEEALKINALFIHYSTDYVYDGTKNSSYLEVDEPCPVNVYGRTKLLGEIAVKSSGCDYLILRTSWVYASRGHNFLLTMLKLAQEKEELSIVADQIGAPTSARLIADVTLLCAQQAIKERKAGVFSSDLYHLTTSGNTSWYGFTKEIIHFSVNSLNLPLKAKNIKEISTSDYPTPAVRPMNSQLALTKLETTFALTMPDWKSALTLCMGELI